MCFRVAVRKLNVTNRRTDRQMGGVAISPVPGPTARREIIMMQSDKDFLSYHENDEISADAA